MAEEAAAAGTRLSEGQRRKLRVWRTIARSALVLTWICLVLLLGLFFWPNAPGILKTVTGAVLAESFLTAVLLGALGKCPACGASFGFDSKGLMPDRCRGCGVELK